MGSKKTKPYIEIWDNGGETIDRYTVIINDDVFGMSENPNHPQGFNQYCLDVSQLDRNNIGQPEQFGNLPYRVKRAIVERIYF